MTIEFGKPFFLKELEPEFKKFPGAYAEMQIKAMLAEQSGVHIPTDKMKE